MSCRIIPHLKESYTSIVKPGITEGIELLELGVLTLSSNKHYTATSSGKETALILWEGNCDLLFRDIQWSNLQRKDVFSERATGIYLPSDTTYTVYSQKQGVQMIIVSAPTDSGGPVTLVKPDQIKAKKRGKGAYRREINDIITDQVQADKLLIGETYNAPGKWSGYPPHKHDVDNPPKEVKQEEIYFFKVKPKQGFGMQRIYSPQTGFDETYLIEDNTVIVISQGYHSTVAAPEYLLYYLWMAAGTKRKLCAPYDPKHSWLK